MILRPRFFSDNQKTGLSLAGLLAVFIFGMVCVVLL